MGEFRTINGSDNGFEGRNDGEAEVQLIRLFDPDFENDDGNTPRGGEFTDSDLPNPRDISNIVVDQVESVPNFLNASDWLWQWGQVLDHDFALNEASPEEPPEPEDFTPIPIPDGDPVFPDGTELPFIRIPADEGTGTGGDNPRQINNQITAFIDGSLVYGSDEERAEFLRVAKGSEDFGKGLLKTDIGPNGEALLPQNGLNEEGEPFPSATGGGALFGPQNPDGLDFLGGDIRVNEQIGLTASHNLLVREHNRIATDLHKRLKAGDDAALNEKFDEFEQEFLYENPYASAAEAKDEFLYESARKVLGAEIQIISYEGFLPLLIGDTLPDFTGFDSGVNPQVSVEYADAAFRLGHTLLTENLRRVDGNGIEETSLAESFFNPVNIQENGIDNLLTGLILQPSEEVDNQIVDGVRNFLFAAGTGGLDLASVNIARVVKSVSLATLKSITTSLVRTQILLPLRVSLIWVLVDCTLLMMQWWHFWSRPTTPWTRLTSGSVASLRKLMTMVVFLAPPLASL